MKKKLLILVFSLLVFFMPMLNFPTYVAYIDDETSLMFSSNTRARMAAIERNVIGLETIGLTGWVEDGLGRREILSYAIEDMEIVYVDDVPILFIKYRFSDGQIIESGSILNQLESENVFMVQFGQSTQLSSDFINKLDEVISQRGNLSSGRYNSLELSLGLIEEPNVVPSRRSGFYFDNRTANGVTVSQQFNYNVTAWNGPLSFSAEAALSLGRTTGKYGDGSIYEHNYTWLCRFNFVSIFIFFWSN